MRLLRADNIEWRMTGAAMAQALDQVGAAIPFVAAGSVGLKPAAIEEEELPHRQDCPDVEWKGELVRGSVRTERLPSHHERVQSARILIGDLREVMIREGRIEMPSLPIGPLAQGAQKSSHRPAADAALRIGRDVRAVDDAERRRQRPPAGKHSPAVLGMTDIAVADCGELRSLHD